MFDHGNIACFASVLTSDFLGSSVFSGVVSLLKDSGSNLNSSAPFPFSDSQIKLAWGTRNLKIKENEDKKAEHLSTHHLILSI